MASRPPADAPMPTTGNFRAEAAGGASRAAGTAPSGEPEPGGLVVSAPSCGEPESGGSVGVVAISCLLGRMSSAEPSVNPPVTQQFADRATAFQRGGRP